MNPTFNSLADFVDYVNNVGIQESMMCTFPSYVMRDSAAKELNARIPSLIVYKFLSQTKLAITVPRH